MRTPDLIGSGPAPRLALAVLALLASLATGRPVARAVEPTIPAAHAYVNDFAGVIDPGTRTHLEALIGDLRAKTGAEIAVVTVPSTEPLTAFDYAMKIAETWKPGAAGKDNGVVFLVAVKDRKLHVLTGYGIEGALPDGRVGDIRDRLITPRFRAGDYAGGIRDGTEALAATIAEEYGVALDVKVRTKGPRSTSLPLGAIVLLLAVMILLARTGVWPLLFLPGRHGRLDRGGFYGGTFGGGGFGGTGGGFGGFGGGSFGGGGAGGDW